MIKNIKNTNEKNGMWRAEEVSYNALHSWVRIRKEKPALCEECKKEKPYDLSNISGKYKRDINDYKYLCRQCHMKNDGRIKKLNSFSIMNRRKNKGVLLLCNKCKQYKAKEDFRKDKYTFDGYTVNCKCCLKERYKELKHGKKD
jgi:hypothetical protein